LSPHPADWPDYLGYLRAIALPVKVISLPTYPFKFVRTLGGLSPAASRTEVDTGTGKRGTCIFIWVKVEGASTDAKFTKITAVIDGVKVIDNSLDDLYYGIPKGAFPHAAGRLGGLVYDEVNYEYGAWVMPVADFTDSLKVVITNGDPVNAINADSKVFWTEA